MRSISLALAIALTLSGCASVQIGTTGQEPAAGVAIDDTRTKQAKREVFRDPELAADYQQVLAAMRAGNDAQAKATLQSLTESDQTLAGPYINLGILLLKEDDYKGAETAFDKAIEANPKSAIAYNQLGLSLRQQGRFKEAEAAYQAALGTNPDYPLAHRNIGILYDLYLQQPQKALPHYQRYLELSSQSGDEVGRWIAELERRLKTGTQ